MISGYKKAVIALSVFAVSLAFIHTKINALNTVFNLLGFIAIIIGMYRYGFSKIIKNPLSWCLLLPLLSYFTTMYVYHKFIPSYLLRTAVTYLIPVILYLTLQTKNDIRYYIKCIKWYLLVIIIYCFYEELTQSNPLMGYCANNSDMFGWMTSRIESGTMRFGLRRSQSLFGSEAAFGAVCIYYFFVIRTYRFDKDKTNDKFLFFFFTFAIPFCILFTGTRSAMFSFLVACIGLVSFKRIKRNWYYYVAASIIVLFLFPYLSSIYDSIINSSTSEIGGSSEEMREGQWEIALYYLNQKPYFGNGIGFTSSLLAADEKGLYGAEGMWLPIMMDRGLFGVVSTLFSYLIVFIVLIKKKMYSAIWVIISFLAFKTITTVVGVSENYAVLVAVFLMRYKEIQKASHLRFVQPTHRLK